jgi:hypothetical protein
LESHLLSHTCTQNKLGKSSHRSSQVRSQAWFVSASLLYYANAYVITSPRIPRLCAFKGVSCTPAGPQGPVPLSSVVCHSLSKAKAKIMRLSIRPRREYRMPQRSRSPAGSPMDLATSLLPMPRQPGRRQRTLLGCLIAQGCREVCRPTLASGSLRPRARRGTRAARCPLARTLAVPRRASASPGTRPRAGASQISASTA